MNQLKNFEWKQTNLDPKNLVYLGIRELDDAEKGFIKDMNIKHYNPYDIIE